MAVSPVARRILDALGAGFLDRAGPVVEDLVDGLTTPLADTDDLLTPTARGWVKAFDLDQSSHPEYLGAATGTRVPGGLSLAERRDYIRSRPAWRRGTPEAIRGAVSAVLEPVNSRRVDLIERAGSPWRLKLRVWQAEVPIGGEPAIVEAAKTQTPVGIVVDPDVDVQSGASYEHMALYHGPTYEAALALFPTYDDAAPLVTTSVYHVPEEGSVN